MDGLYSPRTPETEWGEEIMESLTLAPRKPYGYVCLTKFLHDNKDCVRGEFLLNSNRVIGYIFHKASRVVTLYTTDSLCEFIPGEDPCLVFPDKDWASFHTRVWVIAGSITSGTTSGWQSQTSSFMLLLYSLLCALSFFMY